MKKLPKEIKSIKGSVYSFVDKETERYVYILNEGTDKEVRVNVLLPYYSRPDISFDIIDDSRGFVNGFKVVQLDNKEYAYVKEEGNTLLPFRYDVATDFNEYGYAMVGKDGKVSWIDKNFKYLNSKYEMVNEDSSKFNGFLSVSDFSKGEHPLSKVCSCSSDWDKKTSYFGVDGKIIEFSRYDGEIIRDSDSIKNFSYCSEDFNDKGYATANNDWLILLSSGYYLYTKDLIRICGEKGFLETLSSKIEKQEEALYTKDLIRICEEKGFLDTISSRVEKQEQDYTKFLRDIEEKTTTLADDLSKHNNLITEYGIGSIELKKEKLISSYGKDVYERALTNGSLVCLIINEEIPAEIVDLELFQSSLAKRGIPSYIDNEENIFHYNANKHVKTKKYNP